MAKKIELIDDLQMMEYSKNIQTRIDPGTKFVIEKSTGLVKYVFREKKVNDMIKRLIEKGIPLKQLRKNRYNDILIM